MSKKLAIKKNVMDQIMENKISMKPKLFFVVGSILVFIGLIASIFTSVFLVSLISFLSRPHGPMGDFRLSIMLSTFPWWIVILAIVGLLSGIWFLSKYDFSYKSNYAFIILTFVLAIIIAGVAVDLSGLNDIWLKRGPMNGIMRQYMQNDTPTIQNQKRGNGMGVGRQMNGNYSSQVVTPTALTRQAEEALIDALQDEYKAYATYDAIIEKFGDVRPFSNIINSEAQHIASLKVLFNKYGIAIPENPNKDLAIPPTIQESCQAGVDAEIANAALYNDKLLPRVEDYPDIIAVFVRLKDASQNNHLRAFERCN